MKPAIKNLFNYLVFLLLDLFISFRRVNTMPGRLLVIRLDSIGDYILFRNFLPEIKNSPLYRGSKITLCGNLVWKDLAETFDTGIVDEFIWIDRIRFLNSPLYKYSILKDIRSRGFETVINTAYTREILFGDQIVKSSGAPVRIGSSGSPEKAKRAGFFSNRFYTKLITPSEGNNFEFYRNIEFFELLLNKNPALQKPYLNTDNAAYTGSLPVNFAVIFPGAQDEKRRWPAESFAAAAGFLIKNYGYKIVIAGSENDKESGQKIVNILGRDNAVNLCGQTSLSRLAYIIERSKILISNETGAVHIAAAVNTKVICISNGNHFGRFNPYPEEVYGGAHYIYHKEVLEAVKTGTAHRFRYNSDLNISEVKPEEVIVKIKEILG